MTIINNLSAIISPTLSSTMDGVNLKHFTRNYNGLSLKFYDVFDNINDTKYKNYTNFYLTKETTLNQFVEDNDDKFIADVLFTNLKISNKFISFNTDGFLENISENYLLKDTITYPTLVETESYNERFTIDLMESNTCVIYHTYKNKKFYLNVDDDVNLLFESEDLGVTPTVFKYLFSEDDLYLYLFLNVDDVIYNLVKVGDNIKMVSIEANAKIKTIANNIKIGRNIYNRIEPVGGVNFIKYDNQNNIDQNKIEKEITNNFLVHRTTDKVDIIILKNQLLQNDVFSSSNNMLSSNIISFYVNGLREYTSIFNDINQENDEDLTLNYVFYNHGYTILPGENEIITPDNMEPFEKININDTKFTESGAFPFPIPKYADKIYHTETESYKNENGQFLLCTWLSGSPLSKDGGVWVDRYYYPDLISKESALLGDNTFNITYEDQIEQLILLNSSLKNSIISNNFFDKISDVTFSPNEKYIYSRLSYISKDNVEDIDFCDVTNTNYFKKINSVGKFTTSFYFFGDDENWTFESFRGKINGGLKILKSGENIIFDLNLYDRSYTNITTMSATTAYKQLKTNFVTVSIDTLNGVGYFFLNSEIVLSFKLPEKQFYQKSILFGDFLINGVNASIKSSIINDFRVSFDYMIPELAFIQPILDGIDEINSINITLPCGMRNSSDNISLLNTICTNNAFKSNHIDLYIKNTDLNSEEQDKIKAIILRNVDKFLPINTEINNINFKTYK